MFAYIAQGFLVSFGLIVAIGAQNAHVLKQGLLKQHIFWVCLTCFLCDAVLMSAGVLGFVGTLIGQSKTALLILAVVGVLFLFWYGLRAFKSAWQSGANLMVSAESDKDGGGKSIKQSVGITLALTLLNPHVYLDTLVLVGSIASPLTADQKQLFLMGAVGASGVWFFGLGYGARLLTPLFSKPKTWQILDAIIGVIMWMIALGLIKYAYGVWAG
ncbi:LysE/ArgO family amino acid transporter [Moraxella bovis]|uniref:LysE/ArgO family amino acid transporter n=1 Tax=Moraxella bovis TaxID=476 RepID=A0AAQ2T1Y4_MORBO|nr:LysE/ArgO family amino acid transporter [Moraxella bovis]AWY19666.1 amino acid transporter [Moraxella bovis]OOR92230.1 hypothetical protein B0182_01115 [Moraxella bovis]UYZ75210.1 LysE/ArgO family amino acid transporter [Moraxella bovis]UYZ78858.1 LysE/ArgO family amino acid transporter [Moraxella bovis]UYZ80557.1 LysE/ArgO family amino acid transporter [Moraxella bovis]